MNLRAACITTVICSLLLCGCSSDKSAPLVPDLKFATDLPGLQSNLNLPVGVVSTRWATWTMPASDEGVQTLETSRLAASITLNPADFATFQHIGDWRPVTAPPAELAPLFDTPPAALLHDQGKVAMKMIDGKHWQSAEVYIDEATSTIYVLGLQN